MKNRIRRIPEPSTQMSALRAKFVSTLVNFGYFSITNLAPFKEDHEKKEENTPIQKFFFEIHAQEVEATQMSWRVSISIATHEVLLEEIVPGTSCVLSIKKFSDIKECIRRLPFILKTELKLVQK